MITDKQRRDIAQKLRDAATECYNYGVLESDVLNILGVYATDSACLVSSDSIMDVADLIDRPTTTVTVASGDDDSDLCIKCNSCCRGWHISKYGKSFTYCPECGAEVVE